MPLDADGNEIDVACFESLRGKLKNTRWALRNPAAIGRLHCEGFPRPSAADVLALGLLRCSLGQCAPAGFWLAPTVRRLLDEVARLQSPASGGEHPERGGVRVRVLLHAAGSLSAASLLPKLRKVDGGQAGDSMLVEFEAQNQPEAERLALSLGELGMVVEPGSVRNAVASRLRQALTQYEGTEACPPHKPQEDRE